jgi:hypothetical protein
MMQRLPIITLVPVASCRYEGVVVRDDASDSRTADGSKILKPFGGVPAFNSLMISDFDGARGNSWRLGLSYDFAGIGLTGVKAFANYAHGELPANNHEDEIDGRLIIGLTTDR